MCFFFFLWQQPDGILKMKKLKKVVLKALQESGIVVDETELSEALHQKVSPSIWLCLRWFVLREKKQKTKLTGFSYENCVVTDKF